MTFVACLFLSIGMALAQSRISGKVTAHPIYIGGSFLIL